MNRPYILILIIALAALLSCGRAGQNERLAEIDSLASVNPMGALDALAEMDGERLTMSEAMTS